MENLYEADKAVNSGYSHYIKISTPADLESEETKQALTDLIVGLNIKTSAIGLITEFVCDFEPLLNSFQITKNHIAFQRDIALQSTRLTKIAIDKKLAANYAVISQSGMTMFYTSEEFAALTVLKGCMVIELSVTNAYYL